MRRQDYRPLRRLITGVRPAASAVRRAIRAMPGSPTSRRCRVLLKGTARHDDRDEAQVLQVHHGDPSQWGGHVRVGGTDGSRLVTARAGLSRNG